MILVTLLGEPVVDGDNSRESMVEKMRYELL